MKKWKVMTFVLLVVSIVSVTFSVYLVNELNNEKQMNYAENQTTINNYQVSFSNAVHGLEDDNPTVNQVFYAIEELNSSVQYYESVSETTHSMEYGAVIDFYISALEEYVLSSVGSEDGFEYDVNLIISDLMIISDWLMERNESETLYAHNDDDFYEIYLKLSPKLTDKIKAYAQ